MTRPALETSNMLGKDAARAELEQQDRIKFFQRKTYAQLTSSEKDELLELVAQRLGLLKGE